MAAREYGGPLTEEEGKRFVFTGGEFCPRCSVSLEECKESEPRFGEGALTRDCECLKCGVRWTEEYHLVACYPNDRKEPCGGV